MPKIDVYLRVVMLFVSINVHKALMSGIEHGLGVRGLVDCIYYTVFDLKALRPWATHLICGSAGFNNAVLVSIKVLISIKLTLIPDDRS